MAFPDNVFPNAPGAGFLDRFGGSLDNPLVAFGLALAGGQTPQAGLANAADALRVRQILAQRQKQADLAQANSERDFAFRQSEAGRAQSNADRQYQFAREQAEAAGRGFDYREIEDTNGNKTLVRINKSTGQTEAVPIEGVSSQQPNNPYSYGKMTEGQAKDALYANRMFAAEKILRDPAIVAAATSPTEVARGSVPMVGNFLASDAYQSAAQAQRDFLNAVLRRESGAVISPSEFSEGTKQYFPALGDSQRVLAQKRANREEAIKGIAAGAGRSYRPPYTFENGNIPGAPSVAPSRPDIEAEMRRRGLLQ
jgi:hypothetical protein